MDAAVRAWRVKERSRLKQERMALASPERAFFTDAIARNLDSALDRKACRALGLYWPIRGEFDLREWATRFAGRKHCDLALPVVVTERAPVEYWRWRPGDPMTRGFWGIMVPEHREVVAPDIVIAPLVGFADLYRLGHGGGYFDRTLAARIPAPFSVGVGIEASRVTGYIPQAHDIPMDLIVTEAAIYRSDERSA